MNQRILLRCGKSPFVAAGPVATLANNYNLTNVGNLLFQHAVYKHIYSENNLISTTHNPGPENADEINRNCDAFYIPLANAFRPAFIKHLERLSGLIERLKIPAVVLGVGIQASNNSIEELKPIENHIKSFCSRALAKSRSIGCRGAITANYLSDIGVKDVEIIGCPSMFYFGKDLPPTKLLDPGQDLRIALNLTPHSPDDMRQANRGLSDAIALIVDQVTRRYRHVTYVAQDDTALTNEVWHSAYEAQEGPTVERLLGRKLDLKTIFPLDTHVWIEYLKNYDLSVGTRIHGGIAAVLAGVPSVVIAFDTRTTEICDYFDIPRLDAARISGHASIMDLLAEANFTKMHDSHESRFRNYLKFLDANGISHVFDPTTLAPLHNRFQAKLDALRFPEMFVGGMGGEALIHEKINYLRNDVNKIANILQMLVAKLQKNG